MYLLDLIEKQKADVEGKVVNICGSDVIIGALSDEEKVTMIEEGTEFGQNKTTIDGKETKLIDIDDGRIIVAATEVQQFDGNKYAFWYIWRQRKIKAEWEKLNAKSQEDLQTILTQQNLWVYVEEAL